MIDVQPYQKQGTSVKKIFLCFFALSTCLMPMRSEADVLNLEPFSKEQSIETFHVKQFVEFDPANVQIIEGSSVKQLFVFSNEQRALQATLFAQRNPKPEIKILPLKIFLSSTVSQIPFKNTLLSIRFESIPDCEVDEDLPSFVSSGGILHISSAFNRPDGVEFIKNLSHKIMRKDSSVRFVLSGDGVIIFSTTYHRIEISPLLEACTESFLENIESENLLKVERTILSSITSKELSVFDMMERPALASQETVPLYPLLWKGLFFLEQKEYLEASRCFHKALASGVDHWRVYWYLSLAEAERRNYAEAKRALTHVLSEVPDFKEAKDLLERIEEV